MANRTLIAAHRGGLFLWPENSSLAFRESAKLPVEQAECDVHLTADGGVVVMHDATLDRTTDAKGPVAAMTSNDLLGVRVRGTGGEAPPTLAEYLAILAPTPVAPRIEIKTDAGRSRYPGLVGRTLAALDASGQRGRSWIIGFNAEDMAEAQAAGGLAGVAWLVEIPTLHDIGVDGIIAVARRLGVAEVGMTVGVLDAPMIARFRAAGLAVGTWGANHADTIRRALELRVDVFATDDPPLAVALRG
ncbi:glycerophosphodiester phosphodiesterase [Falsiroseomonas sp. HW251]|uniref:glycerophosphodiester phosphodiesterase n=1 Tax=Falsiroseomonas sp. HW251 TaxID=3390998 RepID=UPI003D31525B